MGKFTSNHYEVLRDLRFLRYGLLSALLAVTVAGFVIATRSDWIMQDWDTAILTGVLLFGLALLIEVAGNREEESKTFLDSCEATVITYDFVALLAVVAVVHLVGVRQVGTSLSLSALLMALVVVGLWAGPERKLFWMRSSSDLAEKARERANYQKGMASTVDIYQHASGPAMYRRRLAIRPSWTDKSPWEAARLSCDEYSYRLLRTAQLFDLRILAEAVVLVIAPPRAGKSEWAKAIAVSCPAGPYMGFSTKPDLLKDVGPTRATMGKVWVCDPSGSGVKSNVFWSLLDDCQNIATAQRTALGILPTKQDSQQESWDAKARPPLAIMLRAAALSHVKGGGRYSMVDVVRWIGQQDGRAAMAEIAEALEGRPGYDEQVRDLEIFFDLVTETRSGIINHICVALAWLSNPHTRTLGDAPLTIADPDGNLTRNPALFDPAAFATTSDALFVIADSAMGGSAIAGALAAEVFFRVKEAVKDITRFPGGRLDPPMTVQIDEADRTCPINLPAYTAEMGGRGVNLFIFMQNFAQLVMGWGVEGAKSIRGNANALLLMAGMGDAGDLKDLEALIGEYLMVLDPDDKRMTPTLNTGMIRSLQQDQALMLRSYMLPAIGTPDQFYKLMAKRSIGDRLLRRDGKYARSLPRDRDWKVQMEPAAKFNPAAAVEALEETFDEVASN